MPPISKTSTSPPAVAKSAPSSSSPPARGWSLPRTIVVVSLLQPAVLFPLLTGLGFLQFGPVPYIVLVLLIVGLANAFVARGWLLLLGGILSGAFVAMNLPFIGPALGRPERYPDYIFNEMLVPVSALALVAGIVGFISMRRGTARPANYGTLGAALTLLLLGLCLGTSAASVQTYLEPAAGGSAVALTADVTWNITYENDAFAPAQLSVAAGKLVKVEVTNKDGGTHDFSIDSLHLRTTVLAGRTTEIWLRFPVAGSFQAYCSLHSDQKADGTWQGMVAPVTVT